MYFVLRSCILFSVRVFGFAFAYFVLRSCIWFCVRVLHRWATVGKSTLILNKIDQRLQQQLNFVRVTCYSKHKDSLQKELALFLAELPGYVTLATVTPQNICRFLIFKDKNGKTLVHSNGSQYIGQKGQHDYGCPFIL